MPEVGPGSWLQPNQPVGIWALSCPDQACADLMEGLPPARVLNLNAPLTFSFSSQNRQYSVPSPESLPAQASDGIRPHPSTDQASGPCPALAFPFPCTTNHSLNLLGRRCQPRGRWLAPLHAKAKSARCSSQRPNNLQDGFASWIAPPEPWRSGMLPARSWMPQHHELTVGGSTGTNQLPAPTTCCLQSCNQSTTHNSSSQHLQAQTPWSPSSPILPSQLLPVRYMAIRH